MTLDHETNPLLTTELHWGLLTPEKPNQGDSEAFWRETVKTEIRGVPTRTLTAEYEFVVMAIHGGLKHEWIPLRVLGDLARILNSNPNLDWKVILNLVEDPSARKWVFLGLDAAHRFLGAEVPTFLLEAPRRNRWHRSMLAVTVARYGLPGLCWPSFGEWRSAYHGATTLPGSPVRRVKDGMLYAMGALTPQYMDHHPDGGLSGLSVLTRYIRRPWRQFRRHGRNLVKKAAGSREAPFE